jgi:hypothetical protein
VPPRPCRHRQSPRDIRSAGDTPAAGDHPWGHGDLPLVCVSGGTTSSNSVTSAAMAPSPLPSPVLRMVWPLAPEHARQHEPLSPASGSAVMRRREPQPPRRLGTPATGRSTVCLSHGQRGSVSPAAPALAGGGNACGAPTLTSRGLSHSGTASAKGVAALASADADGSRGLPQSLGARVHGGGA